MIRGRTLELPDPAIAARPRRVYTYATRRATLDN